MSTRRERFREYIARLRPAESPARAIAQGLYVPRPSGAAVDEITTRIELEPRSAHLIVGGIGSGKSTQLLIAKDHLDQIDDTRAIYIDVSEIHDISQMKPGVLVVVAGVVLAQLLVPKEKEEEDEDTATSLAREQMLRFAHGRVRWIHPDDIDYSYGEHESDDHYIRDEEPPFLAAPRPMEVLPEVEHASDLLQALVRPLAVDKPHLVLLFDALDRLTDMGAFDAAVEQDVVALQKLGIGVVLAGPLRAMYGAHRLLVTERFQDNFYPQMAIDVREDAAGRIFLAEVLRKRVPAEILSDEVCDALVHASGGALRDLIALARTAVEGAFRAGRPRVEAAHVEMAARAMGERLLFGLRKHELDALLGVAKSGIFAASSDDDLSLLATQRVLAHTAKDGGTRYAIHPTLLPLIGQLQEAS